MSITWTCPACGIVICDDESPCSLEYGAKCGAEMSRDDLREEVTRMASVATARERLLAEYIRAIAQCHAALKAIHYYETVHDPNRGALFTPALHRVEDAIALCQGRRSAWTTSEPAPSCAPSLTTSSTAAC